MDRIQEVDFVFTGAPIETVIPADLRFDVIYGSHVLEHQVDLIGHLQSLEKLLAPGGRVIEIIPDYRRCFDALRYPTVTSDAPPVRGRRVVGTRTVTLIAAAPGWGGWGGPGLAIVVNPLSHRPIPGRRQVALTWCRRLNGPVRRPIFRTYRHGDFDAAALADDKARLDQVVSVCLPAAAFSNTNRPATSVSVLRTAPGPIPVRVTSARAIGWAGTSAVVTMPEIRADPAGWVVVRVWN